ncbi:ecto-ADP-ribosyltransferase 5-like [Gasterosteus aculeatus]
MRMKMMMAVMVLWVVLLPYGVSGGNLMPHAGRKPVTTPPPPPPLPLDMAPNSVDDMYKGCVADMEKKAKDFLKEELKEDEFNQIWEKQEATQPPEPLTKEENTALLVYTSNAIYADFNKATREQGGGREQYKTAFKYHALHFYLTRAVQKIKAQDDKIKTKNSEKTCYNVYRRTNKFFHQDVLNKTVRLGSFSSTSRRKDLTKYGKTSCFEIHTCMGADVMKHSVKKDEKEVLIPPYEVFNVTEITERSEQPDLWCDVVYKLESTKNPTSNLNCALIQKKRCKFPAVDKLCNV